MLTNERRSDLTVLATANPPRRLRHGHPGTALSFNQQPPAQHLVAGEASKYTTSYKWITAAKDRAATVPSLNSSLTASFDAVSDERVNRDSLTDQPGKNHQEPAERLSRAGGVGS
jgi:hypothetical protein